MDQRYLDAGTSFAAGLADAHRSRKGMPRTRRVAVVRPTKR
jgi:hypothetical protein